MKNRMEGRKLGDQECVLIVEEEKRLCENGVQLIKGLLKKDLTIMNGEIVKKDKEISALKLNRILENRDLYVDINTESAWKLITDKDEKKMYAFLQIKFLNIKVPELHFCFEMSMKLYRAGDDIKVKHKGLEVIATPMTFDDDTDTALQWMNLLLRSEGNIAIIDEREPSVGIDGVPIDIPSMVLGFFDNMIKNGGIVGNKPVIWAKNKKELKSEDI